VSRPTWVAFAQVLKADTLRNCGTPLVRSYEVILLVFGGMAGITWAMLALFLYNMAGDGLPSVMAFTVLLPLTAAFFLGAWLHAPIDMFSLLIGVGAASGLLSASACTLFFRLRGA